MLNKETSSTSFWVFGMTQPGSWTSGEHSDHNANESLKHTHTHTQSLIKNAILSMCKNRIPINISFKLVYYLHFIIYNLANMRLNCIWWWGSSSGGLKSMEFPFHCSYFQINLDPGWYYLLGFHLCVKSICLKIISI